MGSNKEGNPMALLWKRFVPILVVAVIGGSVYGIYQHQYTTNYRFRKVVKKNVKSVQQLWRSAMAPVKPDLTEMDRRHEQTLREMGASANAAIQAKKGAIKRMQEMHEGSEGEE